MSAVVLSFPADSYRWGPLYRVEDTCRQTAALYLGEELVCQVTVQWPTPLPAAPVVCHTDGPAAAARD
jgi:hypothetical protein